MQSTMTGEDLELLIIRKYFLKDKGDRYAEFVSRPKTRAKFVECLAHLKDLDFGKFQKLAKNEADQIREKAAKARFDSCYAISENRRIDRQFLDVESALRDTIGHGMGNLLVFGTAEFVYYEGEDAKDRWISI